jgi:CHAT domain-containing protein
MGLMDSINLRQELDLLSTEYQRRIRANQSVTDLLPRAAGLEASARHLNIPDFVAVALMRRAEILNSLGCDQEVIALLEQARQVLGDWREQDLGVRVLALLAEAYAHRADWGQVSVLCEEGIALVEKFRYKVSSQYLQSAYLRYRIGLYAHGVRAAYELGDFELMLQRAELSKCRSLLREQGNEGVEGGAKSTLSQKFTEVCTQIDAARGRGRDVRELLVKRRTLWDLLAIERLKNRSRGDIPKFTVANLQSTLGPDESVLYYYWLNPGTLLLVAVDAEELHAEVRPVSPEARGDLESFAQQVVNFKKDNLRIFEQLANFQELLTPSAAQARWAGRRSLLISPHRMLHSLPLHALRWEGKYWIEKFGITYVPNLTSLLIRYQQPATRKVCLVGIANYAIPGYENKFAALPEAETEVAGIGQTYRRAGVPANSLKPENSEHQLQELDASGELGSFSCLHFAVHGENINSDTPMESYLALGNSLLDGLEIANWKLTAELVVLSACCSGQRAIAGRGMGELPGDEMLGLTAALFTAGARRVFSTLWPVESDAAVPITRVLHERLAAGLTPEFAWQEAVCTYLRSAGPLQRRLYYWGPFFLSGMGRPVTAAQRQKG